LERDEEAEPYFESQDWYVKPEDQEGVAEPYFAKEDENLAAENEEGQEARQVGLMEEAPRPGEAGAVETNSDYLVENH
jgi:hypothetical protein